MADAPLSAAERIAESFKKLATSAVALNKVSDEFSKPVEAIEQALERLNIGVEAWEKIRGNDGNLSGEYWHEHVGYSKVQGRWGIAISKAEGNHSRPEDEKEDVWAFNQAPRSLRISAVDKLPELLEKLVAMADKTARKMEAKKGEVETLAKAVRDAGVEMAALKKGQKS